MVNHSSEEHARTPASRLGSAGDLRREGTEPRVHPSNFDPPSLRRHDRDLEALLHAGLSHDEAEAQLARLEKGDIWCG